MNKDRFEIGQTACTAHFGDAPEFLLIQPADDYDLAGLDRETEALAAETGDTFLLAAFKVGSWNRDLSPWKAPAVFGPENFGDGAEATLGFITEQLLPAVISRYSLPEQIPVILGGYSLAGFFSLWSAYQTDAFRAAAAVSPSVWFPGWIGYAGAHQPRAGSVYLSLGNKEPKTKNRVMSAVGDCIRRQQELLSETGIPNVLEWNEGNHFKDPDLRCARGFAWCIRAASRQLAIGS